MICDTFVLLTKITFNRGNRVRFGEVSHSHQFWHFWQKKATKLKSKYRINMLISFKNCTIRILKSCFSGPYYRLAGKREDLSRKTEQEFDDDHLKCSCSACATRWSQYRVSNLLNTDWQQSKLMQIKFPHNFIQIYMAQEQKTTKKKKPFGFKKAYGWFIWFEKPWCRRGNGTVCGCAPAFVKTDVWISGLNFQAHSFASCFH